MSDTERFLFFLAQLIFLLWPVFILVTLVYAVQTGAGRPARRKRKGTRRKAGWPGLGKHIQRSLLVTWTGLFLVWVFTWLADGPTPSLLPEPANSLVFLGGLVLVWLIEAARLGIFRRRLAAHMELQRMQSLAQLETMDPYVFEELVTETYHALGYLSRHVGHSGDHGVDVEVRTRGGDDWVVQCKRYRGSVGESIVRELYGTMVSEQADRGVLVTTAEITPPARAWARGKPLDLVDGSALLDLLAEARRRGEHTWLHRVALAVESLFGPRVVRGLLGKGASGVYAQPLASAAGRQAVPARQAPICPRCGVGMTPHPDRSGRALFRCSNYPNCRVVLE